MAEKKGKDVFVDEHLVSYTKESTDAVVADSEDSEEEEYVPETKEYMKANSSTMERKKKKMMKKKKITVWSEKDEIAILEGLIKLQKSSSSSSVGKNNNNNNHYSFIKDSLVADVSRSQFNDKVKSLKRKFLRNKNNYISDPNFSIDSDHNWKVFMLSKEIFESEPEPEPESEEKIDNINDSDCVAAAAYDDDDDDDDDDDKKKKKKKKKRKIVTEAETAAAVSSNVFHKEFHNYCLEKGLEVKWLEKHDKHNLQKLWKEFSELECDRGIIESKYSKKKNDLDEAIFVLLKHCYNSFPALFDTDY